MQYFPTSHIATVTDYPYGRLRAKAYFGTEFSPKHGFRSTFQTINPKTGRLNAVKNSTYYPISLLYLDPETGHYKHHVRNPSGDEGVNQALDFICQHHSLFTPDELAYIGKYLASIVRAGMIAAVVYCGAEKEKVGELQTPVFTALLKAAKEPTLENFQSVRIDCTALDSLADPNFKAFRSANHGVVGS
jgi:hypothetical protein